MSRQASPPPAFPPTPEDETGMAELHPDCGRAKSTQGITPVSRSGIMDSVVDTPTSPSSSLALSRFEFEYGKGNEGGMGCSHSESKDEDLILWTKPMPAIYPTSLGSEPGQAGRRGVLHTLWARQNLAGLEAEIEAEMKVNSESVGLQIALQEQGWISTHFGASHTGHPKAISPYLPSTVGADQIALSRSPIGGKLGEKLSGLRLATSPTELAAALHNAVDVPMLAAIGTSVGLRTSIEPHISVHGSLDAVVGESQNGTVIQTTTRT
ncbi:hypothetical protein SPBR_00709 [Sporothrix brasiliensis 5110]|uniref:Uncharacterized protein n=1 Tax=Sporothrix brasiliensis 5110 TaxID=1398154 RepID=A0A0C2IUH5_9PEZI|nr:uncharacterized protein SPBR_00709 [Sporothrix brasiliensis 5110]KIH90420.1 hypothetical protein SPBR_00709 [Sporothrix brasiliensis 5110]